MNRRSPVLSPRVALLACAIALASCSEEVGDGAKIQGHWRAERFKLQSLNLPIGPELVFTAHELHVLGADVQVPIFSFSEKGNEVVVEVPVGPAGVGLSFYFEGQDRMYFDVPLGGKIYYQRLSDTRQIATPGHAQEAKAATVIASATKAFAADFQVEREPTPPRQTVGIPISTAAPDLVPLDLVRQAQVKMDGNNLSEAEALLLQAKALDGEHPMVDYHLAILRTRQADGDAGIRHLNDAFRHGFRAFTLLDANPDFVVLKSDVRYEALISRYK
ncbi:MAG TPA: hypothetical protein PLR37_07295 [Candidatus Accumulibacter phosphatis]|nr:hypothetical protein [Candidatus Accumulibacter phosphatis]